MIKLKTYNRNVDKFLNHVLNDCKKRKIDVLISLQSFVRDDGKKVNGYFDDSAQVLAISINKPLKEWLRILIHEYAHSLQYQEQCDIWVKGQESYDKFFRWLEDGKKLSKKELNYHCRNAQMIELDCERRALKLVKEFDLPISQSDYCKRASAYVYFYQFIKKVKRWYKVGNEPYRNEKILSIMPTNLDGQYNRLNKVLINLFLECI